MDHARFNGNRVHISEIDEDRPLRALQCIGCNAEVSFVRDFERNVQGATQMVRRFFRLSGKNRHDEHCSLAVGTIVQQLAAESEAAEGAASLLAVVHGGHVLRLHVLVDAIDEGKVVKEKSIAPKASQARHNTYAWNGRTLPPYLKTALAVARLYLLLDSASRAELRKVLTIDFRGTKIKWSDFCYTFEDYPKLAARLLKRPPNHPIAIELNVKGRDGDKLQSFAHRTTPDMGHLARVIVPRLVEKTLGCISEEIAEPGSQVIAVANGYCYSTPSPTTTFLNMYFNIHRPEQVALLSEVKIAVT